MGTPVYIAPGKVGDGDEVVVRLAGEVNGVPFDLSRRFAYTDLMPKLIGMAGQKPEYGERMRAALTSIADEIVAKISTAQR